MPMKYWPGMENMTAEELVSVKMLGADQTFGTLQDVTATIASRVKSRRGGYYCVANTHQLVIGLEDPSFRAVQTLAIASFPDSAVLTFSAAMLGANVTPKNSFRGYDLFKALMCSAQQAGFSVGFYGGLPERLEELVRLSRKDYPRLKVVFKNSPPFRDLQSSEVEQLLTQVVEAEVDLLFVGIGCPKQELFMYRVTERLPNTVMVGVGAAFDFYVGAVRPSPAWVHQCGLEWFYRLLSEPRRLGRRYLKYNTKYLIYFIRQLLLETKK